MTEELELKTIKNRLAKASMELEKLPDPCPVTVIPEAVEIVDRDVKLVRESIEDYKHLVAWLFSKKMDSDADLAALLAEVESLRAERDEYKEALKVISGLGNWATMYAAINTAKEALSAHAERGGLNRIFLVQRPPRRLAPADTKNFFGR